MRHAPDTSTSLKSHFLAVRLEGLIPGLGAAYAGQMRVGVMWLVVTVPGYIAFLASMFVGFIGYAGDFSGYLIIVGYVLGIALFLWLIVRRAIVGSYVDESNADARRRLRRRTAVQ